MEKKRTFKIISINISKEKGTTKQAINQAELKVDWGIVGDAHAGDWHRQISLLAKEEIDNVRDKIVAAGIDFNHGSFAENIETEGVDLASLPVGTRLYMGDAVLEVTQIGKECHHGCAIAQATGDCIMPTKGIFAKVIKEGTIDLKSSCYLES